MRINRIVKLGHKNVTAHKLRSFLTIVTVSALTGVLMAGNFLIQGYEDLMISEIDKKTENEALFVLETCEDAWEGCSGEEIEKKIADEVQEYDGNAVGYIHEMVDESGDQLFVIDRQNIEKYIEFNLEEVPENVVPIVVSIDGANDLINPVSADYTQKNSFISGNIDSAREQIIGRTFSRLRTEYSENSELQEEDEEPKYMAVGIAPATYMRIKTTKRDDDITVLSGVANGGIAGSFSKVFVVSSDIEDSIKTLETFGFSKHEKRKMIINFDDSKNAFLYRKKRGENYNLTSLFINSSDQMLYTKYSYNTLFIPAIILLVVSLIITLTTFMRIIDQEKKSVALYYSLGATKMDVLFIYLAYLVELCILSVILSTVIGLSLSVIVSVNHIEYLLESLECGFGYVVDKQYLIGFNIYYLLMVSFMIMIAPVCVLLSIGSFSTKKIARKLKES
jgi:hypothetical protein